MCGCFLVQTAQESSLSPFDVSAIHDSVSKELEPVRLLSTSHAEPRSDEPEAKVKPSDRKDTLSLSTKLMRHLQGPKYLAFKNKGTQPPGSRKDNDSKRCGSSTKEKESHEERCNEAIRVCERNIERCSPIPVLIAVSAPLHRLIDFSELLFLQTLIETQHAAQADYPPGLRFILRLEDLTQETLLLPDSIPLVRQHCARYLSDVRSLISAIGANQFVTIAAESELMDREVFLRTFSDANLVIESLSEKTLSGVAPLDSDIDQLRKIGWKGDLTAEIINHFAQIQHSILQLPFLSPTNVSDPPIRVLDHRSDSSFASHLIAAITSRRNCNGSGTSLIPSVNETGFLELSLMPPVPSTHTPPTRLFRRSLSQQHCKAEHPYWRCTATVKTTGKAEYFVKVLEAGSPQLEQLQNGSEMIQVTATLPAPVNSTHDIVSQFPDYARALPTFPSFLRALSAVDNERDSSSHTCCARVSFVVHCIP